MRVIPGLLVWSLLLCGHASLDQVMAEDLTVGVNQVRNLAQVEPDSWDFRSLQSLIERLGLTGKGTFGGNRALSRFEFALRLNTVLDRLDRLIALGQAGTVTKAELLGLERLRFEFEPELASLRARTERLEVQAARLEPDLFSPTTKLEGSVIMAVTGGGGGEGSRILTGFPDSSPPFGDALGTTEFLATGVNTSIVNRTSLTLRSSFFGKDELLLRMRGVSGFGAGASLPGIANGLGPLFYAGGPLGSSFDQSTTNVTTNGLAPVSIDELYYAANFGGEQFRFIVAGRVNVGELVDTNSFSNNEEVDFSNGSFLNNQLITYSFSAFYGPGAGFGWQVADFLRVRAIYTAGNGGASSGDAKRNFNEFGAPVGGFGAGGLFGGQSLLVGELVFEPSRTATIKLQYARAVEQGAVLGTVLPDAVINSISQGYGINAEWAITPGFALFGRYAFATTDVNALEGSAYTQIGSTTWHAGFTLPNFLGEGNGLGFAYGQPVRVHSGSVTIAEETTGLVPSGVEGDFEIFYRIRLTDRLTITPDLQFIVQPVHSVNSNGLTVGTVRAVFNF